jgi:hypothetical protein
MTERRDPEKVVREIKRKTRRNATKECAPMASKHPGHLAGVFWLELLSEGSQATTESTFRPRMSPTTSRTRDRKYNGPSCQNREPAR